MKERDSKKWLIITLVAIILILAGILIFLLAIRPAITGNTVKFQNQGIQYAIAVIAQQAASCNVVPLVVGNQTINVVSVDCVNQALQQPAQAEE